ncbi:MAG: hypothetical protein WCW84_07905 [Sulfurimonas sp.]|jgi:hypothetical protein
MIIIHNLDTETENVYLAASVKNAKNKADALGIAEAFDARETVVCGRTIYEYNRPLEHFVEKQGRFWKSMLREAWMTGNYPRSTPKADIPALQRLRNSIGAIV